MLLESGETRAKTDIDQFKWRVARTRLLHYPLPGEEIIQYNHVEKVRVTPV